MTADREVHEPGCVLSHAAGEGRCADGNFDYLPKPGPADPSKPMLTGLDVCRIHIRLEAPWIAEKHLDESAREFLNRSKTGELGHVFAAAEGLIAAGYLVSVEGGSQRTEKKLPWE